MIIINSEAKQLRARHFGDSMDSAGRIAYAGAHPSIDWVREVIKQWGYVYEQCSNINCVQVMDGVYVITFAHTNRRQEVTPQIIEVTMHIEATHRIKIGSAS